MWAELYSETDAKKAKLDALVAASEAEKAAEEGTE